MYRERLTNFNTAAIYDDIYENIWGGYEHLCPPSSTFEGDRPLLSPLSLRPWIRDKGIERCFWLSERYVL